MILNENCQSCPATIKIIGKKIVLIVFDFYLIPMLEKKSYISVHIILCIICVLPEILINICIKSFFFFFFIRFLYAVFQLFYQVPTKMFLNPVDSLVLTLRQTLVYISYSYIYIAISNLFSYQQCRKLNKVFSKTCCILS